MTRDFVDPDFGPATAPAPPSREEFEDVSRQVLATLRARRVWPAGSVTQCPACRRPSFIGRDDLSHEIARPGAVVVFRHLRGARCESCGAQSLEPADLITVESEAGVGVHPDFEAKVTTIGSGTVGTYWPKDVVRNLGLVPDTKVFIQVVDRRTALVRFHGPPKDTSTGSPRARRRKRASPRQD